MKAIGKNTATLLLPLLLLSLAGCAAPGPDSVAQAEEINDSITTHVDGKASKFLVEMVDARLMDYQEGKLAAERGTREAIRAYGRRMLHDQADLLKQLDSLALASSVTVPIEIGAEKRAGLGDLQKLNGEDFDQKFMSMIRIDHKRDVGEFEKASTFDNPNDAAIRDFAAQTLPLIRSHLAQIDAIRDRY